MNKECLQGSFVKMFTGSENHFSDEELLGYTSQVSGMVGEYVSGHKGEMLIKSSKELSDEFRAGLSVLCLNGCDVVGHACLYPLKNEKNEIVAYELGTVIVREEDRGKGYGSAISEEALSLVGDTLVVATVKRENTVKALKHAGMVPVGFVNNGKVIDLTCSCETNSGGECVHRRGTVDLESIGELNLDLIDNLAVPCTLMVNSIEKYKNLEGTKNE